MRAARSPGLAFRRSLLGLTLLAGAAPAADFRLPDLDGDGKADVVLRHDDGNWRHFAIDDAGGVNERSGPVRMTPDADWHPAAVGDFNGDGRDDFLLRRGDGRWIYYPMNGGDVIAGQRGAAALTARGEWRPVAAGDLDGDGRDDMLLRRDDGRWAYYPMNGKRVVAAGRGPADLPPEPDWRMAAVADFDGDGRDEVLLRHHRTGGWRLYRMQGRRVESVSTPGFTRNRLWRFAGAGDFDGDGSAEALFRRVDGRWGWQSARAPPPTVPVRLPRGWQWRFAGVGDVDGDGHDDVLARHDDGRWRYLRMGGTEAASASAPLELPAQPAWSLPAPAVHIPDTALRATIESHLDKPPGDRITRRQLAGLAELLTPFDSGIGDLTGLRFARGLERLQLVRNRVEDLEPLMGLPELRDLWLSHNRISDLAPIAGLTGLDLLGLSHNRIADAGPLLALTRLTWLEIRHNELPDIARVASRLRELSTLDIGYTGVGDLLPLARLPNLTTLDLDGNGLTEVAFLSALPNLTGLRIRGNEVTDIAPVAHLTRLRWLDLDDNPLENLSPVAELRSLQHLSLVATRVNDLRPVAGLDALTWLEADRTGMADLAGIENLANLTRLSLAGNRIEDITALARLVRLTRLDLRDNRIEDLSPLAGLTRLESLRVAGNRIRSIEPLASLTGLTELGLARNEVADLSPLTGLTGLVSLDVAGNAVADVGPLQGLTALRELNLAFNRIEDLSPLLRNTGLGAGDTLDVRANPLDGGGEAAVAALVDQGVEVASGGARVLAVHDDTIVVMAVDDSVAADTAFSGMSFDVYANAFFTHFEDEFDYLLFFSNLDSIRDHEGAPYAGIYLAVMNDTEGLGVNAFYRRQFGSAGKLRGVVHFPYNRALRSGPALHELQHAWSNFVVDTGWPSHWGFSSADGQLGGFDMADFVDLGDGRYSAGYFGLVANGGNGPGYSPIELYYAGFIPPEEVPDLHVAEDAAWLYEDGAPVRAEDGGQVFTASGVTTYGIDDLIAEHGARVPSMADARWHHRAALVLLVDDDHPATGEQLARLADHAAYMSHPGNEDDGRHNFHEATGGRGSIGFDLAGAVKARASPPANLPASFGVAPPPRYTSLAGHCRTGTPLPPSGIR